MRDGETTFSSAQLVSGSGASDNVVQLDRNNNDVAGGEPVFLRVVLTRPAAVPTDPMTVGFEVADNPAMSGAAEAALWTIPAAALAEGGPVLSAALPAAHSRGYARLQYGDVPSGVQVTADLGQQGQTNGVL